MSTLQSRVENYTGSITDTTALTDRLTAGVRYISDLLPERILERYSTSLIDNGSGVSLSDSKVLYAVKDGYRAREIHPGLAAQAALSTSIYKAIDASPVYYSQEGKGYLLGTTAGGTIYVYAYPVVAYSDTSISNFPSSQEHTVVLYAAYNTILGKIFTVISSINSETIDSVTAPIPPTAPSFTYTSVTGDTVSGTTIAVSETAPTVPIAPLAPSFTYTSASGDTVAATSISVSSSLPGYTKPVSTSTTIPSALDMSFITIPTVPNNLVIGSVAPAPLTSASYSYTDAVLGTYTSTTIATSETAPSYVMPVTSFDLTNAKTYLETDEDIEKAIGEIDIQKAEVDNFGKELYNRLNTFNSETEVYKSTIEKEIAQAKLDQERLLINANKLTDLNVINEAKTLEASIQTFTSNLRKQIQEIEIYKESVNKEVQQYSVNLQTFAQSLNATKTSIDKMYQEYKVNLERWQSQRDFEIKQFTTDIQNELSESNQEAKVYELELNKAITQAQITQQRLIEDAQRQDNLELANNAKILEQQVTEYTSSLQRFRDEIVSYQSEVGLYNSYINKAISQAQLTQQRLLEEAQRKDNIELANNAKDLEKEVSEYVNKLQLYQAEIAGYQNDIQLAIQKTITNTQKYTTELQGDIQLVTALKAEFNQAVQMIKGLANE